MNLWAETMDEVADIERGSDLTLDQQLMAAQIRALLLISQELSLIQDQGISPKWSARSS